MEAAMKRIFWLILGACVALTRFRLIVLSATVRLRKLTPSRVRKVITRSVTTSTTPRWAAGEILMPVGLVLVCMMLTP